MMFVRLLKMLRFFNEMIQELNATPFSKLTVTPIVRTRRPKADIPIDNLVTIHTICGERKSPKSRNVNFLKGYKFIYVKYDEFIDKQKQASELVSFISDHSDLYRDYEVVALTDKALNKMKDNNIEVIEMDEWLKTYNFSADNIRRVKEKVMKNFYPMRFLSEVVDKVNDSYVKELSELYEGIDSPDYNAFPEVILNTIKTRYLQEFMQKDNYVNELFTIKYPLAKSVAFGTNYELRDEVVNYMNSKG